MPVWGRACKHWENMQSPHEIISKNLRWINVTKHSPSEQNYVGVNWNGNIWGLISYVLQVSSSPLLCSHCALMFNHRALNKAQRCTNDTIYPIVWTKYSIFKAGMGEVRQRNPFIRLSWLHSCLALCVVIPLMKQMHHARCQSVSPNVFFHLKLWPGTFIY